MLPREELDPTKDTVFYGLDSLVSIEIRNWITREFGAALQILDLLSSGSFVALADIVLRKTELVSFEKKSAGAAAAAAAAAEEEAVPPPAEAGAEAGAEVAPVADAAAANAPSEPVQPASAESKPSEPVSSS